MKTEYSLSIYENMDGDAIDCETSDRYVRIDYITVAEHERGIGHGRRLVREAIAEAKVHDLPIYLVAGKMTLETDLERLVEFYKSEGFSVAGLAGDSIIMQY